MTDGGQHMNQQPFMIRAALTNVEWAAIVVALQFVETKRQLAPSTRHQMMAIKAKINSVLHPPEGKHG